MFNYEEIIANLNSEKVIQLMLKLGVENYIEKEDYIIFPTICHNINPSEASMKLYYYKNNKLFYCYTEDGPMSIFNFLKNYYKTRDYEYNWYNDVIKLIEDCSDFNLSDSFLEEKRESLREKYQVINHSYDLPIFNKEVLEVFTKIYPQEWINEGISEAAIDKFNILYSISQHKIIIPHYDINNNLVGIRGRALEEWEIENVGKYLPVKIENKWFSHKLSFNLYGLNHNQNNIKRNKIAYIFESEKSVLQFESFSLDNCAVATCGSNFNKFQLNLLLKYCYPEEIVICFDKEEKDNSHRYFNKLFSLCKRYNNYCNFSFIYDTENLLDLKDSPSDKGEEIFIKLLNSRRYVRNI